MNKTCAISAIVAVISILVAFGVMYQGEAAYSAATSRGYNTQTDANALGKASGNSSSIISGTWKLGTLDALYWEGYVFANTAPGSAINDQFAFTLVSPSTTPTLSVIGLQCPSCGIITVYINGVSSGTIDMYAVGTTRNTLFTLPLSGLTTNTPYSFSFKIATKTGSGYDCAIEQIYLT